MQIFLFFIFSFLLWACSGITEPIEITDNFTYTYESVSFIDATDNSPIAEHQDQLGMLVMSVTIWSDNSARMCYHSHFGNSEGCIEAVLISRGLVYNSYELTDNNGVRYVISRSSMFIHEPWNRYYSHYEHIVY